MIRFLQISDLHYLNDYSKEKGFFAETVQKMTNPLIQLDCLLHNEEPFDFVLVTGDLCEFGKNYDYQILKLKLEDYFNCPIIATPGNHDDKQAFCQGWLKKEADSNIVEQYCLKDDLRVIALDSASIKDNDGEITKQSVEKLKMILKENSKTKTIVITHHHLIKGQSVMREARYSDELLKVLENDCIIAILTGHTHHPYKGEIAKKPYYTTGCLSFMGESGKEDGEVNYFDHGCCTIYHLEGNELSDRIIEAKTTKYISTVFFG